MHLNMQSPLRFPRLHLRSRILILVLVSLLLVTVLVYRNSVFLLVRWHFKGTLDALTANDDWLTKPPIFSVNIYDVVFIVKTGYSTRQRLFAIVDAFSDAGTPTQECVVLVGDYSAAASAHNNYIGPQLLVHDVLAEIVESGYLASKTNATRLQYHMSLTDALSMGETDLAQSIGESHGWELDIMKVSVVIICRGFSASFGLYIS